MHEPGIHQILIDEGAEKELTVILFRMCENRFGPPSNAETATFLALTGPHYDNPSELMRAAILDRLVELVPRILTAKNWQEFLNPGPDS